MTPYQQNMAQTYTWQHPDWPNFTLDEAQVAAALPEARQEQGKVLGLFRAVGLPADAVDVESVIWTEEAVATAAIEGEKLDLESIRRSVMRRLGVPHSRKNSTRIASLDGNRPCFPEEPPDSTASPSAAIATTRTPCRS